MAQEDQECKTININAYVKIINILGHRKYIYILQKAALQDFILLQATYFHLDFL